MLSNERLRDHAFLAEMYRDGYFPDHLVDRVRGVLLALCHQIEATAPRSPAALYALTDAATLQINDLNAAFCAEGSELETVAREVIAHDFETIAEAYGFTADREALVSLRDW